MKKSMLVILLAMLLSQLSWAQWTTSGTNIYSSNTTVGIGTGTTFTSPAVKLEIVGPGTGTASHMIVRNDDSPSGLQIYANSSGDPTHHAFVGLNRARGTYASPTVIAAYDRIGAFAACGYMNGTLKYATNASIEFFEGSSVTAGTSNPSSIRFFTTNVGSIARAERMRIEENGNVGIGTTTPSTKFHVSGSVRIDDGTQGIGKILTSDATGLASWVNPSASLAGWGLTGNAGTVDGTSFLGTTDNVPLTIRVNSQKAGRIDGTLKNATWGYQSGNAITTGSENTAIGQETFLTSATGTSNTAIGFRALYSNTTANNNTALGSRSLQSLTIGAVNIGVGLTAGNFFQSGNYNVFIGDNTAGSMVSGTSNTFVGSNAGWNVATTGFTNSAGFGASATPGGSNQIQIGDANITKIGGQVGWSTISDGRFKTGVRENIAGLEFINQLRPVSYKFDKTLFAKISGRPNRNSSSIDENSKKDEPTYSGFIAQEVDAVVKKGQYQFSGVVAPQNETDHYSIRYGDFVVPLVKAVQELSKKATEQQALIDMLVAKLGETAVAGSKASPNENLVLQQNVPNPFTADTEIKMTLPDNVRGAFLIIYNLQGSQLKSISVDARGETSVKIAAGELGAGMYLYSLIADGKVVDTKRMILMK